VFERLPQGPVKPALALSLHTTRPDLRTELLPRAPLADRARACLGREETVLVLALGSPIDDLPGCVLPADADAYGHDLYATLRQLDAHRVDRLLVEMPPNERAWFAVLDRLRRAASDVPEDAP
jgi:hypothetical protein